MADWKFQDPPNVAVITHRKVASGEDWIAHVSHDADDGAWQFLGTDTETLNDNAASVVSLQNMVQLDPSITELADLPLGWHAWRESRTSPWERGESA